MLLSLITFVVASLISQPATVSAGTNEGPVEPLARKIGST
jgi:hypothetical protein